MDRTRQLLACGAGFIAGEDRHFDPPVELSPGFGPVHGQWLQLSLAGSLDPGGTEALYREISGRRARASRGQILIVRSGAECVCMADDEQLRVRVLLQATRKSLQILSRFHANDIRIEVVEKARGKRDLNPFTHAFHD